VPSPAKFADRKALASSALSLDMAASPGGTA